MRREGSRRRTSQTLSRPGSGPARSRAARSRSRPRRRRLRAAHRAGASGSRLCDVTGARDDTTRRSSSRDPHREDRQPAVGAKFGCGDGQQREEPAEDEEPDREQKARRPRCRPRRPGARIDTLVQLADRKPPDKEADHDRDRCRQQVVRGRAEEVPHETRRRAVQSHVRDQLIRECMLVAAGQVEERDDDKRRGDHRQRDVCGCRRTRVPARLEVTSKPEERRAGRADSRPAHSARRAQPPGGCPRAATFDDLRRRRSPAGGSGSGGHRVVTLGDGSGDTSRPCSSIGHRVRTGARKVRQLHDGDDEQDGARRATTESNTASKIAIARPRPTCSVGACS